MKRTTYRDLIHSPHAGYSNIHPELTRYIAARNRAALTNDPADHAKAAERLALVEAARAKPAALPDDSRRLWEFRNAGELGSL